MLLSEFKNELKAIYSNFFDGSAITVNFYKSSIFKSVIIKAYLIKDQTEAINNITLNDMFRISFQITKNDIQKEFNKNDLTDNNDLMLTNDLVIECWDKYYTIKPDNKYMAYSSKSVSFRKTSGSPQKILKTLENFFQKLHNQLHDDLKKDLIHNNHIELLKLRLKD